jgi:hypothetical protein
MKLMSFLFRAGRSKDPVPAPPSTAKPAAGMAYLRAQAGYSESLYPVPGAPAGDPIAARLAAAEQAGKDANWPESERLWQSIQVAFPHLWYPYTGGAAALCGQGRFEDARALLAEGAIRFPLEPSIRHELGRLAVRQSDWPAAETHWRVALALKAQPWWVYTELAGALERQGRIAEAEAVLLDGQTHDPGEISLFTYAARLAWMREDGAVAVARWAEARRRFPSVDAVSSGLYQALMSLAEQDPAAADRAHKELGLASVEAVKGDEISALLLRFESLGGSGRDGGCEFGGVQRERGIEPLGLFRWAGVTPPSLIACLEGRFAGIGDADATTVYVHDDDPHALWQIGDTTYGTMMHSFVASKDVPHERMMVQARKRMLYLKVKLVADLENPSKIFVLKVADRQVTADETEALSRAIRSYGPGELLCVCPADQTHPEGEIVPVAPGVFVGYIDFSGRLDPVQRHEWWERLCAKMLRMSALPPAG